MKKIFTFLLIIFIAITFVSTADAYIVYLEDVENNPTAADPYTMYANITGDGTNSIDIVYRYCSRY